MAAVKRITKLQVQFGRGVDTCDYLKGFCGQSTLPKVHFFPIVKSRGASQNADALGFIAISQRKCLCDVGVFHPPIGPGRIYISDGVVQMENGRQKGLGRGTDGRQNQVDPFQFVYQGLVGSAVQPLHPHGGPQSYRNEQGLSEGLARPGAQVQQSPCKTFEKCAKAHRLSVCGKGWNRPKRNASGRRARQSKRHPWFLGPSFAKSSGPERLENRPRRQWVRRPK